MPPQAPQCPLPDPQAQGSAGPRLPEARKLAKPQGLPFIAPFPLSAVPPGPGLTSFFHSLSRRAPHKPGGAGVHPSRDALRRPRCSGSQTPVWLGRPREDPALRRPIHPRLGRGSFSMGRGGAPGGGASGIGPSPISERPGARNPPGFQRWSRLLSSLGALQAGNGVAPRLGRGAGREGSSGRSGERCAVEEGVSKEASATASLRDLGGHTFRMLVPALLVLLFCLRGHAGTSRGG